MEINDKLKGNKVLLMFINMQEYFGIITRL